MSNATEDFSRFIIQQVKTRVPLVNNNVLITKSRDYTVVKAELPAIILVGPDLTPHYDSYDIEVEPAEGSDPFDNKIYDDIIFRDFEFELIAQHKNTLPLLALVNQIEFNFFSGMAQFVYPVASEDDYDLDIMIGMGSGVSGSAGGRRPNLSNLRVSSGRFRINRVKLRPDIYREGTEVTEKEVIMEVKQ